MGSTYGIFSNNSAMELNVSADKKKMDIQARSEGDGMENITYAEPFPNNSLFQSQKEDTKLSYSSTFISSPVKRKEPKFVPYEPYKAAVSPVTSNLSKNIKVDALKIDINSDIAKPLITKVIADVEKSKGIDKNRLKSVSTDSVTRDKLTETDQSPSWELERDLLQRKIEVLTKEKKELENQFNVQTKVNADLKKLLVASLGEDLQTKVQYMSEDKAKLGEDVLFYSQKLKESKEEIDRLSVQCDVWKSKFEASSLLVDELANWKVVLSSKFNDALEALQALLKEHDEAYSNVKASFSTLLQMQEAFDVTAKHSIAFQRSSLNLCQLTNAIKSLSQDIKCHLIGNLQMSSRVFTESNDLPCPSTAELLAQKVISNSNVSSYIEKHENNYKTKPTLGIQACHILPHVCSREPIVDGCSNCSGSVLLI